MGTPTLFCVVLWIGGIGIRAIGYRVVVIFRPTGYPISEDPKKEPIEEESLKEQKEEGLLKESEKEADSDLLSVGCS
ncbi:hypothetical protein Tco_1200641 [Tanacetum coccineum]